MFRRGAAVSFFVGCLVACAPMAEPLSSELPTLAPTIMPPPSQLSATLLPSPTYTPLSLMGEAVSATPRPTHESMTETPSVTVQPTLTRRPAEDPARTWTPAAPDDVSYNDPMYDWQCISIVSLAEQVLLDEARKQAAATIEPAFPAYPYQMLGTYLGGEWDGTQCWPSYARDYLDDWKQARTATYDVIVRALPERISGGPLALRMTPAQIVVELEPIVAASQADLDALMRVFAAHTDYSLSEYQQSTKWTHEFVISVADPNLILTSDAAYGTLTPKP